MTKISKLVNVYQQHTASKGPTTRFGGECERLLPGTRHGSPFNYKANVYQQQVEAIWTKLFLIVFGDSIDCPLPVWCFVCHSLLIRNLLLVVFHLWTSQPCKNQLFMKIEWLTANVTVVRSPVRAENAVFWVIFDNCQHIWTIFFVGDPLGDLETPSWALKALVTTI